MPSQKNQKTVAKKVVINGKGLHTGRLVRMEILPAAANFGIQFQRTDSKRVRPILAQLNNISSTRYSTTIGEGPSSVSTIEHLMAAFAGMEIDNALVKINAPEVPILDGSSLPFFKAFKKVGLKELALPQKMYVLNTPFTFTMGDSTVTMLPQNSRSVKCHIDFDSSLIGNQSAEYDYSDFESIAQARTFCHFREINALRAAGLALGGSLDNAIVVNDDRILNPEGLRVTDEFAIHKLLDCVGDFALLGAPLMASIEIVRPGHGFHAAIMQELMLHKDKYLTVIEAGEFRKNATKEINGGDSNQFGVDLVAASAVYG